MVVALVRRFFGALARRLPVCLPQQTLLRQAWLGSSDGVAWTAARLRLALVFVVVARWSSVGGMTPDRVKRLERRKSYG
jgi:hypothetical protein